MQRLILFRHGEALARAPSGRDIDRALTPAGEAAASRIAATLAAAGMIPDIALVSNARRTTETWACARPEFPLARMEVIPDLYNASAEAILKHAAARPEAAVMVVGHNPGLQGLALDLLRLQGASPVQIARLEARFPPATAAVFSFEDDDRPVFESVLMGGTGA
jgi:phosphohistidine phosphatase